MSKSSEVVVVTGASSGAGRAIAQAYGARGARVALLARGRDGLEGARRDVEAAGGQAVLLPTDVSDPDQVEAAASRTEAHFGPIDTWVNVAMTTVFAPVSALEPAEIKRVMEVNYLGYVYGTMSALARMRPRNRGSIVQVGSALAFRGIPLQAAYCASKAAIVRFCDSLRCELIHDGCDVHVSVVHMPALNTPQFDHVRAKMKTKPQPMPPIFQPEVAAEAVLYAADHKRRELTVGGSSLQVRFGNAMSATALDHFLASKGYSGQLTDEPLEPGRPDNLFEAPPGDPGAHGRFDESSKSRSLQLRANERPGLVTAGLGAGVALLAGGLTLAVMAARGAITASSR